MSRKKSHYFSPKSVEKAMPTDPVTPGQNSAGPDSEIEIPINPGDIQDRMLRYNRNPACPECAAHPVICMMRRPGYSAFRCRVCGYRWEGG